MLISSHRESVMRLQALKSKQNVYTLRKMYDSVDKYVNNLIR